MPDRPLVYEPDQLEPLSLVDVLNAGWLEDGWPDAGWSEAGWPEEGWPDADWPDAGWPDADWPDAGWPDAGWPDAGWPDAGWPDAKVARPRQQARPIARVELPNTAQRPLHASHFAQRTWTPNAPVGVRVDPEAVMVWAA